MRAQFGEPEDEADAGGNVPGMGPDGDRMEVREEPPRPSDQPRITTRYMTKYEKARILGTRALQIRCGSTGPAAVGF